MPSSRRTSGRSSVLIAAALVVAAASCRHVAPVAVGLPDAWRSLATAPAPFAALYQLDCCGQRRLLATVRADGAALALTVVVPPGSTALEAWVEGPQGWVSGEGRRCRTALPEGRLPLTAEVALPLDASLAALLLSGRLHPDARVLDAGSGLVEAFAGRTWMRWQLADAPPRVVQAWIGAAGEEEARLSGRFTEHHGSVPGRAVLDASGQRVELRLVEWQPGAPLVPPAWVDGPPCRGAR